MKKLVFFVSMAVVTFTACNKTKDCETVTPTTEATAAEKIYIQDYLTANSITAVQKNGVYYTIAQGTGTSPNACGRLAVKYKGQIMNATTLSGTFDETVGAAVATFNLNQVIVGWQIVFPLAKAGSTIALYIPPSLAYGSRDLPAKPGYSGVPANSYLKFDVELVEVQN